MVFVLASGVAAHLGCGGDEPANGVPTDGDGGPAATFDAGPGPNPNPGTGKDGGDETEDAGPDGGPKEGARIVAYAFSNNPAAAESTPSAVYSYNASGGAMKITRTSAGNYSVTFTGLAGLDGSVALASAYDLAGGLCHWAGTTGEEVRVRCLNAAGSNTDAKFTVTVVAKSEAAGATIVGFAHANEKASASYTPQASRSNNGVGGGAITASRSAVGTYKIEFGGVALDDIENVQLMPYGDEGARCVVKSWGGTTVNLHCYDVNGALADAEYAVLLAGKKPGGTAKIVSYAHANESESASYAPTLSYNEGEGAVTASRSAAGTYAMTFDGRSLDNGAHVQVSAQSQGRRCNVQGWAGAKVDLTCTSASGTKSDNNYAIVVLQ